MTPKEHAVLRELGAYCGALAEDLAVCAEAVTEISKNQLRGAEELGEVKELLRQLVGKVGQLYDAQCETDARIGAYLQEQAKHDSGVRQVDERLRALETQLGRR